MSTWAWERVDPDFSGSSGDLAKIFRHEPIKYPGVLAEGAPSGDASILAREAIQNSWDAARALRRQDTGEPAPDFEIEFRFERHADEDRDRLVEALGLAELADRARRLDPRQLGLGDVTCLPRIEAGGPVKTLQVIESGTTGMYGPWRGKESKLYLALVSLGFTQKDVGAGGSYGYGKAGLIRASATRTLLAYSCFRERPDDPGVTRRLLGMTYWGLHEVGEHAYSGFARMGRETDNARVIPYENEHADRIAANLHLAQRDPSDPEQLGTTFLMVEPTVAPGDLANAVERNWWPALMDPTFGVEVTDYRGRSIHPRPKSDPILRSFIRAHEVVTVPQDNTVSTEKKTGLRRWASETQEYKLGAVGFVADPTDWSYPTGEANVDDGEADPQRSLVALIRSPQMVVQYLDVGGAAPVVRGAFVADEEIDDLLRQTEPKAHDAWDTEIGSDGVHPDAAGAARAVIDRVRRSAADFRKSLRPPTPDQRELRLPDLENLYKEVLAGGVGPAERAGVSPPHAVMIDVLEQRPEIHPDRPDQIRLVARVGYRLTAHVEVSPADVFVRLRYKFVEDGRSGKECPLTITPPSGFVATGELAGGYRGQVGRDQVVFDIVSGPYHPDWSGRLVAAGELSVLVGDPQ